MRVLITTFPNRSHLLTMIPIAWALRNAGHEVQIAAYPSLVDEVIAAGLTPVLVGDGEDGTVRTLGEESFDRVEEQLAEVDAEWQLAAEDRRSWAVLRNRILPAMAYFCPPLPAEAPQRTATDDLVAYARSWRPDLVLWDPAMVGSPVAARVCGAAHARVLWGPDYFGWVLGLARSGSPGARLAAEAVAGLMRPHAERHGVEFDPETVLGQWTLDPMAAPLRLPSPARSIPMRWVPYNGSRPVPDWLREPPRRPRICIPAATTGYERDWQRVSLGDVLEAVAESDVEALVTMNSAQRAMLPRIPDNVRTMAYLPLSQILPTCSAIIHHGGDGTAAAAANYRIPQLIVPLTEWNEELTGEYVAERGGGVVVGREGLSVPELRKQLLRVITEPSFQLGAGELHADLVAAARPGDLVPAIEELTALHRAKAQRSEHDKARPANTG